MLYLYIKSLTICIYYYKQFRQLEKAKTRPLKINETCVNNEDCLSYINNSMCSRDHCSCAVNYIAINQSHCASVTG